MAKSSKFFIEVDIFDHFFHGHGELGNVAASCEGPRIQWEVQSDVDIT
jgi:hypothetical protein